MFGRFFYRDTPHTHFDGSSFAFVKDITFFRDNNKEIIKWVDENRCKIQSFGSRHPHRDMVIVFSNQDAQTMFKLRWEE